MDVGIIGRGFVGNAIYEGFAAIEHDLSFYDPIYKESKFSDILDTACVFIQVPTNAKKDGRCDTTIVESTCERLSKENYKGVAAIKSTVIPGTTNKIYAANPNLRLSFVPEFLKERSAPTDFIENQDVCIIGAYNDEDYKLIKEVHGSLPQSFAKVSPLEAEICKYFNNVFNASRIILANGFYKVCKEVGADYQKVLNAVIKRKHISSHYLRYSESLGGFGGTCLPKDTLAFMKFVEDIGLGEEIKIFETIVEDNKKCQKTVFSGMRKNSN
jgi:UDPglucose 6-dehydrogenase